MPRNRARTTQFRSYSTEVLKEAVGTVIMGELSIRKAAVTFNVPKNTLTRYVKKGKSASDLDCVNFRPSNEHLLVFTPEEETLLKDYLKTSANMHHGLTMKEACRLAYEFAVANSKQLKQNWEMKKEAGIEWLRSFMARHNLSLRTPEQTSLSRATSFNRTNVVAFYSILKEALDKYKIAPQDIYNLDESGLSTVHKPPKIIAATGQKQVGQATSAERGTTVTVCCIVGATGKAVPPFIIFPRVRFYTHMLKGAPLGSAGAATKSGWMVSDLFIEVLKHFVEHERPTVEKPKLILLDNHESHLSIAGLNYAKENGIILLTFPPHCSHKLQPLDLTVFGPLKTYFNTCCNNWFTSNPGKPISIYDVCELFGKAYPMAFTPRNIIRGFESAGIVPFNSEIFTDDDYLPSFVSDRPLNQPKETEPTPSISTQNIQSPRSCDVEQGPSKNGHISISSSPTVDPLSTINVVSPEEVRPFPKAGPRKIGVSRKKRKSCILTDTPNKKELEDAAYARKKKNPLDKKSTKCGKKTIKRKLFDKIDDTSSEDSVPVSSSEDEISLDNLSGDETHIETNDFIVGKVYGKTKASVRYYVAKVVKRECNGFAVEWFKRHSGTFKFSKSSEPIAFLQEGDIVLKLPSPTYHGDSGRFANMISFHYDLSSYSIV